MGVITVELLRKVIQTVISVDREDPLVVGTAVWWGGVSGGSGFRLEGGYAARLLLVVLKSEVSEVVL